MLTCEGKKITLQFKQLLQILFFYFAFHLHPGGIMVQHFQRFPGTIGISFFSSHMVLQDFILNRFHSVE